MAVFEPCPFAGKIESAFGLKRLVRSGFDQGRSFESRVECPTMPESPRTVDAPRVLVAGRRLDQPTYHALYEAMPPGTRAELIGGVVCMPSPVGRGRG